MNEANTESKDIEGAEVTVGEAWKSEKSSSSKVGVGCGGAIREGWVINWCVRETTGLGSSGAGTGGGTIEEGW